MQGGDPRGYLSDDFLGRVRRSYELHVNACHAGRYWGLINERRRDVHAALLADNNSALREIFADPASTDLYYGVDNLCRSIAPVGPEDFTAAALANFRGRMAEYQARQLVGAAASFDAPVVEIGAGMGRVAYLAYSKGLTDYTTIDLPLGVVAQACFLARVLQPDQIWLEGESNDTSVGRIKLIYADKLPKRKYHIALNVDSLPEMPAAIAFDYAQWLGTNVDLFLSINQEHLNNFTVSELFSFACAIKPQRRNECLIWPRYFEETYSFTKTLPGLSVARRKAFELLAARRYVTRTLGYNKNGSKLGSWWTSH